MKAILIIDMPQNCVDCPCSFTFGSPPHNICEAMNDKSLTKENMNNTKSSWCPLKPMPERKKARKVEYFKDVVHIKTTYDYIVNKMYAQVIYVDRIFAEGYNACLDEILGEEE